MKTWLFLQLWWNSFANVYLMNWIQKVGTILTRQGSKVHLEAFYLLSSYFAQKTREYSVNPRLWGIHSKKGWSIGHPWSLLFVISPAKICDTFLEAIFQIHREKRSSARYEIVSYCRDRICFTENSYHKNIKLKNYF